MTSKSLVPREAVEGVLELPERLADPLARRLLEHGGELRARPRVAGGEERHVVAGVGEPVGEQRDDPLDPAVAGRRHREPDRAENRDPHVTFTRLPVARRRATSGRTRGRPPTRGRSSHSGASALRRAQLARGRIGLEPEQEPEQQHGRPRRPRLRPGRGRVRDRELASRCGRSRRTPRAATSRRSATPRAGCRAIRSTSAACARAAEPPRAEGRVVRPDGAVVVAERVVRRVRRRHRPDPPARPELVAHQPAAIASARSGGTIPLQSRWPRFEQSESTGRFSQSSASA